MLGVKMYVGTVLRQPLMRLSCYCAVIGILFSSGHAFAEIRGLYKSPIGLLKLSEKNGVVRARQHSSKGPCGFKKGKVVFEGSRLDDSLTGDLRTCQIGPNCSGEVTGMAMLLISQKGQIISGAVHVSSGECATPLKGDGIRLRKKKRSAKKTKKTKKRKARQSADKSAATTDSSADSTKPDKKAERSKNQPAATEAVAEDENSQAAAKEADRTDGPNLEAEPSPEEKRAAAKKWAYQAAGFLGTGNAEKARELFQNSVDTDPEYSQGYVGLGITYYQRDRYDEALEQYKKAVEVNPSNPDAYYNMACIYALQNEQEQAINFLRIALLNGYVNLDTIEEDSKGDFKNLSQNKDFKKMLQGRFD
jgi:Flp pilus assembly protein TadD